MWRADPQPLRITLRVDDGNLFVAGEFCVEPADASALGRRSLPPNAGEDVAISAGDHGVSDPGARACNGPPPVRRVAHAMAVRVLSRFSEWSVAGVGSAGESR